MYNHSAISEVLCVSELQEIRAGIRTLDQMPHLAGSGGPTAVGANQNTHFIDDLAIVAVKACPWCLVVVVVISFWLLNVGCLFLNAFGLPEPSFFEWAQVPGPP